MKTEYLTHDQLFDITGHSDRDKIQAWLTEWNKDNPADPVQVTSPQPGKIYQVHAGTLPDKLYCRIEELERFGVKYAGNQYGPANANEPECKAIRKRAREYWHDKEQNALSFEASDEITRFIEQLDVCTPADVDGGPCEQCATEYDCCEYDCNSMQLTVACSGDGKMWNYQTGDNSYTGGAYSLPHWSVVYIGHDTDRAELAADVINELNGMIEQ